MRVLCKLHGTLAQVLDYFTPLFDLFLRLWISDIFLKAALTKIQSWDTTVTLFEYEYNVPLVSAQIAAYVGTGIELFIPIFIVFGLGGRLPALILFVFNVVAVISYPYLLTEQGAAGFEDHVYWGIILLVLMFYGTRSLSLDHLIHKYFCKKKA